MTLKKKNMLIGAMIGLLSAGMLSGCTMDTSRRAGQGYLGAAAAEEEEAEDPEKTGKEETEEIAEDDKTGLPENGDEEENDSGDTDQDGDDSDGDSDEDSDDGDSDSVPQTGIGRHIVIDPGHQEKANEGEEFIGPGAAKKKQKATVGSKGVVTETDEYELNLEIAFLLQEELEERGFEVILTRDTNDVDISNAERAQIANDIDPTAFIRIHADASSDPETSGIMTICQSEENPYNGYMFNESNRLSTCILDSTVEETGAKNLDVWWTDTMTGINWSTVPTCQIQVGYLSNAEDDTNLQDESYRRKIASGIAKGIDDYVTGNSGDTDDSDDA
ncbi:MAG TPA: N-acetylmuramoyl-L-alanine amidase [Lachnospiraceae bacterium]|nr:N-acetylmuramoyl-L-alanine amidase [Lachnospiraceae bacterium]